MNPLQRWFGAGRTEASCRWIVVDTETTGLDPARDSLLAIGAVAVEDGAIALDDSLEINIRPDLIAQGPDILIHGMGIGVQSEGIALADALAEFDRFADNAPRIAFHAAFDAAVLRRARTLAGRPAATEQWLDLALLAPVLLPRHARRCRALDEWLDACGIACLARHNAAGDALATGQLLALLLGRAREQGLQGFAALARAAKTGRWAG